MKEIITIYAPPPIPYRGDDWTAVRDGYEPHDPIGRGVTRDEAIADLKAQENPRPDWRRPTC